MDKKNLHQRIAAVMAEVDYIQKERKAGMSYTIVSHDAVTAKVRPVLLKHGVIYYPVRCDHVHNGNRAECEMTVRFANVDDPLDFIDVPTFGYGVDPQDKGPGKAMSYAVKYALLKTLGLETGDDADNDSIAYTPADPHVPPFDAAAAKARIAASIAKQNAPADVDALYRRERSVIEEIKAASADLHDQLLSEFKSRKHELTQKDAA